MDANAKLDFRGAIIIAFAPPHPFQLKSLIACVKPLHSSFQLMLTTFPLLRKHPLDLKGFKGQFKAT